MVLTFLNSLACFLWATVDLAVRGWLASAMMLGLIAFACVFVVLVVRGGYLLLELLSSSVAPESEALLFMWARRVTGEGSRDPPLGGCHTEAKPSGRRVSVPSAPLRAPPSTAGMHLHACSVSFVQNLRLIAFSNVQL